MAFKVKRRGKVTYYYEGDTPVLSNLVVETLPDGDLKIAFSGLTGGHSATGILGLDHVTSMDPERELPLVFACWEKWLQDAGIWCSMSIGHGQDGKPLHFSAWCKEQMGWMKPTVIDPRVKQKLILKPVGTSDHECYKVLLRADGENIYVHTLLRRLLCQLARIFAAIGLPVGDQQDSRQRLTAMCCQ